MVDCHPFRDPECGWLVFIHVCCAVSWTPTNTLTSSTICDRSSIAASLVGRHRSARLGRDDHEVSPLNAISGSRLVDVLAPKVAVTSVRLDAASSSRGGETFEHGKKVSMVFLEDVGTVTVLRKRERERESESLVKVAERLHPFRTNGTVTDATRARLMWRKTVSSHYGAKCAATWLT